MPTCQICKQYYKPLVRHTCRKKADRIKANIETMKHIKLVDDINKEE